MRPTAQLTEESPLTRLEDLDNLPEEPRVPSYKLHGQHKWNHGQ